MWFSHEEVRNEAAVSDCARCRGVGVDAWIGECCRCGTFRCNGKNQVVQLQKVGHFLSNILEIWSEDVLREERHVHASLQRNRGRKEDI